MHKVLIAALSFSRSSHKPRQMLEKAGCELIWNKLGRPFTEEELLEFAPQVDAIIVGVDPITKTVLESTKRLKIIAKHGVGVDNIDLETATRRGIIVTNTPGANENAVADLAMGLILAVAREIPKADRLTKAGEWPRLVGTQIWEKTLGIVGFGRIGKGVARRASGFKMRLLAYDPFIDATDPFAQELGVELTDFEKLLKEADFISIHVPLTPTTTKLFNADTFKKMKPTAFIVNTSRGEVIDEMDLKEAIENGLIAGAALDVYSNEPPKDLAWLNMPRLITTPHIGAYTREANQRMGEMAADAIIKVLRGEKPPYQVNA